MNGNKLGVGNTGDGHGCGCGISARNVLEAAEIEDMAGEPMVGFVNGEGVEVEMAKVEEVAGEPMVGVINGEEVGVLGVERGYVDVPI